MRAISYLPSARADFDEAFDWYVERSVVAAERFASAVDAAVKRIAENPESSPDVDGVHQDCPVKRFPFRVIFRQFDDQILIVAIAHAKRRPDYWQRR